jgi:hypothetical protein
MSTSGPEVVKELFKAVKGGDISKVRELLSQGINPNERNSSDEAALMAAAEKGNLEIFDLLQQAGGDLGARAKNGSTVLFRAARCLHGNESAGLEMLQRVITAVGIGADQEAFNRVLVLCSADRSPDYLRPPVRLLIRTTAERTRWEPLVYPPGSAPTLRRPRSQGVILRASDEDARGPQLICGNHPSCESTTSLAEIHAFRLPDGWPGRESGTRIWVAGGRPFPTILGAHACGVGSGKGGDVSPPSLLYETSKFRANFKHECHS